MKEVIANRTMYGLKMLVAVVLALSVCTIFIPLLIPPGFGGWIHEQVIEPHLRFLGSWYVWPTAVRHVYVIFWYVYFIVDVVLLFAAKRLWTLLIYISILIASTYASLYTLKDALAFPVPY